MKKKFNLIDFLLISLIGFSTIIIVYRMNSSANHTIQDQAKSLPVESTSSFAQLSQNEIEDSLNRPGVLTGISTDRWQNLETNDRFFTNGRRDETPGCSTSERTNISRVVTTFRTNVDSLIQGKIDFLFGLYEDSCFKEGNTLILYVPESNHPYTSFRARLTAKIAKLYVASFDLLSTDFFDLAGLDKLNYSDWRTRATHPSDRLEVVARLTNIEALDAKANSTPTVPPVFFRTSIIQAANIESLLSKYGENYVVFLDVNPTPISVRPKKGRYLHLPFNISKYAHRIPYGLPQAEISEVPLDLTALLSLSPKAVILIGAGEQDARSFYVLSHLESLVTRFKLYWLFGETKMSPL